MDRWVALLPLVFLVAMFKSEIKRQLKLSKCFKGLRVGVVPFNAYDRFHSAVFLRGYVHAAV